ncbi:hypothetical protein CL656_05630 [bacterium]|nr:hypothetical protein [bacterium]
MDKNNSENITENIKIKFTKIKQIRNKIKEKFICIQKVKNGIKENYFNYIKKEQNDFFGLDSFHFQNKVLDLEFNNMMKLYQFIDNRIYGDYYKLFSQIEIFSKKNLKQKQYEKIKELKNIEKYPIYRDLEQFKCYDFDTINNIHQDIIVIIASIKDLYKDNEKLIKEDMKNLSTGLNIDNYIINSQYKNMVLLTTNNKFESYLQVYHKYHYDLLFKFREKLALCYQHINHNPNDERFFNEGSDNSSVTENMEDELLNAQFSVTPVNNSRKHSSVDLFFSENKTIIEEQNEIIEDNQHKELEKKELEEKQMAERFMNVFEKNEVIDYNNQDNMEPIKNEDENGEFIEHSSKKKRKKRNKKNN